MDNIDYCTPSRILETTENFASPVLSRENAIIFCVHNYCYYCDDNFTRE